MFRDDDGEGPENCADDATPLVSYQKQSSTRESSELQWCSSVLRVDKMYFGRMCTVSREGDPESRFEN